MIILLYQYKFRDVNLILLCQYVFRGDNLALLVKKLYINSDKIKR